MEELKIYSWDIEQLRTLASLAAFQPEMRNSIINVGKKILDGIEPSDKKTTLQSGEKVNINDYRENSLVVTMEDLENMKFIDRMMILLGIESGYVKIAGSSDSMVPPQYIIKMSDPVNAGSKAPAVNQ